MVVDKATQSPDSIAEILGRAFEMGSPMPRAAAELILRARFPAEDVKRVDKLLALKREQGLTPDQESLLRDYLHADSLLGILQSKARRDLGKSA